MWGLLVAAFLGVFGSMFGTGSPLQVASRGMVHNSDFRTEYAESYFSDGFQKNDEPSTKETIGEKTSEITSRSSETDEKTFSGINIPVDVSKPSEARKNENSTDALTVLSGN